MIPTRDEPSVAPAEIRTRRRSGLALGAAAVVALAVAYHRKARPRLIDWGASAAERAQAYSSDPFAVGAARRGTYAITIAAPPADVWPWLVQMGAGRAGWYGYDLVDNRGAKSADRILPASQALGEGDLVPTDRKGIDGFTVIKVEPERDLILGDARRAAVWGFHLVPEGHDHTRLVVRTIGGRTRHPWSDVVRSPIAEPLALFMQRKQLCGIKRRAERLYAHHRSMAKATPRRTSTA